MSPAPDNILILGLAKTGSTGLYNNTKAALARDGHDYYCLFEPRRPSLLKNVQRYAPELPILTKVMVAREPALELDYGHFPKRVTLVRDPRDMIVSFLLFRPFIRADALWEQVERFVAAVRMKEADPSSWSVRSLHNLADELGLAAYPLKQVMAYMERQEALIERHNVHILRYEEFIAGRLNGLDEYLGLQVDNSAKASPWLDHILRSASTGDWRHWFTEEDIDFYRPYLTPYMEHFKYTDGWDLADQPKIDPATASGYIEGKYRKRFEQKTKLLRRVPLEVDTAEQRTHVRQLAEDGNAQAMYRLATAVIDDDSAAFQLIYRAAVQGHRPAMRRLARLYARGRGVDCNPDLAAFWAAEVANTTATKDNIDLVIDLVDGSRGTGPGRRRALGLLRRR